MGVYEEAVIVGFILEDGAGLEYGVPQDDNPPKPITVTEPAVAQILRREGAHISGLLSPEVESQAPRPISLTSIDRITNYSFPPQASATVTSWTSSDTTVRTAPAFQSRETPVLQTAAPATVRDFASPAKIEELSRRHEEGMNDTLPSFSTKSSLGSTDGTSPASLPTSSAVSRPNLSRREAYLVQHFISRVGPWMDVCDLSSHFTHELPRRAMHNPMVLYAIFAVTSRHLAILSSQPEPAEASYYHGQCLRLVIDRLSGPEALYDDNLLSTVVCLRIYEEIEHTTDEHLHLYGTSRLVRTIPTFAHSGGLGEAACWQSLRQDIYISLVRGIPPSLYLESFDQSSVFTFRDDAACANIIVLLFAKILRVTYTASDRINITAWDRLAIDVEAWNNRRLRLFQPIYYEDLDTGNDRPFPIVHMISPPQVAALQYYHACKTYLLLFKPNENALSGFHAAKRRRNLERDVTYQLAAIVGLAESNPFVENANFTAHHLLRIGGYCITNPLQRERVLGFLDHVEQVMGWSTSPTVALLRGQWDDLDNPSD